MSVSEVIEGFNLIGEMATRMGEDLAAIHSEAWSKLVTPDTACGSSGADA